MGKNSKPIVIRKFEAKDIENIVKFFIEAYGEKTVFQNESFLSYYFGYNGKNKNIKYENSLVGLINEGKIV